jgi:hypothetical protein
MSTPIVRPVASVSLAAVALVALLAGCSSPTSGATAGSAAPVAESGSPSTEQPPCPNPHGGDCLGRLAAGEYETTLFSPRITYTAPDGWTNLEDLPGNFQMAMQADEEGQDTPRGGSYLGIYRNVRAPALNCREAWEQGVGWTPAELAAWYQTVPGLITSEPLPVTVGGFDGLQIDLALEPGVEACSFDGNTGIPMIMGDGVSSLHHVVLEEMDVRLVLLEWGEGNVTLEITNVREQHSAEEFRSQLQPIIDSLVFDE